MRRRAVLRRGRRKTVCARGASLAALAGRSSLPLDRQGWRIRAVPREPWGELFDLVTAVLLSDAAGDTERFAKAFTALRALYARQKALEKPDPALTEALADYTDEAAEAVALYRVAIAQSASYPDEPTHTKRICLASRLIDLGDFAEARSELALGRADAARLKDAKYVKLADKLLSKLAI